VRPVSDMTSKHTSPHPTGHAAMPIVYKGPHNSMISFSRQVGVNSRTIEKVGLHATPISDRPALGRSVSLLRPCHPDAPDG
jgi:hypothetical protein